MSENYVDPNSGASAQPGGYSGPPAVAQEDEMVDVGADTSSMGPSEQPAGNAKRDDWVEYARKQGAPDDELKPQDEGGLSRDELRDKYGA